MLQQSSRHDFTHNPACRGMLYVLVCTSVFDGFLSVTPAAREVL